MNSKTIILSLISSWCALAAASESNNTVQDLPCSKKLKPCLNIKPPDVPPITCCRPLTKMIGEDVKCLCQALRDEDHLKKYNTTRADALSLVRACRIEADLSLCYSGTSARGYKENNAANKIMLFVVSLVLAVM